MRAITCILAALLLANVASAQIIDPDFDNCQSGAAIVDTRWDLIDTDTATEIGVKAGYGANGTWYLNAKPGDLVRAWMFVRSCTGVNGVRFTGYWYDNLIDMVSWEPGPNVQYVSHAPFKYSTANGGLANGGYSSWRIEYDFTHQAPGGQGSRAIAPGEVLDLGFMIFRVTGENESGGGYRVAAWNQSGYTYDYKVVKDTGELYSNKQDSTLVTLLDPEAFLPAGEFPLFGTPPPVGDKCTADINGDGRVGTPDWQEMGKNWGKCVNPLTGAYGACQ